VARHSVLSVPYDFFLKSARDRRPRQSGSNPFVRMTAAADGAARNVINALPISWRSLLTTRLAA